MSTTVAVRRFWIDSNVLMQAKNDYYAFDIAPGFWTILRSNAELGVLCSSLRVYDEIAKGGDDLTDWAKDAQSVNLFIAPNKEAQKRFGEIAEYVVKTYNQAQSALFLKGADPWVIAAAIEGNGFVVTQEKLVGPDSKKVKIPNLCKVFNVEYMNSYDMVRKLGGKLIC